MTKFALFFFLLGLTSFSLAATQPQTNLDFSKFTSWGVSSEEKAASINLAEALRHYQKKKDVVVAVIDTGIDVTHPFLADNIAVIEGKTSASNYGVDFSKDRVSASMPMDEHGHGTHVSGIIKSVFKDVKLLSLKYFNLKASGQENLASTIAALKYAVNRNVDIINYSGGGPEPASEELAILKEAEKKGILVVAAAGNDESNIDNKNNAYYPACYGLSNIITVAGHDQGLNVVSSSNYGKKSVDITAPGYRIKSSIPGGRSSYLTGTSQATAFVTGVAGLIKSQFPQLSPVQIKDIIKKSADKGVKFADKCSSGGKLDAGKALEIANVVASNNNPARNLAASKKAGKIYYRTTKKRKN